MPKSKRPAPRRRAVRRSGGTMPSRGKVKSTSRSAPAALARSSPARAVRAKSTRESETIAPRGKYVYCIIQSERPLRFDAAGIADERAEVHTVGYRDLAAVVSDVPIGVVDSTRENVLAHERVNEIVMREHTVIPMSFGTIFKTRDDIVELLRSAQDAFGDVLNKMRDKMEFGLKVLWDRDSIIQEIEQEDEDINRLKKEIALQKGSTYFARMQYGRAIDAALQSRSERYVAEILDRLRSVAVASRINKPIGDKMIMNAAFLVSRDLENAFDAGVKSIASGHDKLTFKYTGPWPPYNFVNIRLKLERV
jgi:Gas vesicle synthesis protein GvpL/GvpF